MVITTEFIGRVGPGSFMVVKVCRSSGVRERPFILISTESTILGGTRVPMHNLPLVIWETQGHYGWTIIINPARFNDLILPICF